MSTRADQEAIQPFLEPLCAINAAVAAYRVEMETALVKAFAAGMEVTGEERQKEYDLGYARGRWETLDRIKKQLLDKAADKWKRKQDVEADQLRNLAESINLG